MPPVRASSRYAAAKASSRVSRTRKLASRRRVTRLRKSRIGSSLNVHRFSRYAGSAIENSNTSGIFSSYARHFRLQDVINYTDFTTLFDRYMITRVVCYVQLVTNPDAVYEMNSGTTLNRSTVYPRLWYVTDYDDDATTSLDNIREVYGVKSVILRPNATHTFTVKPAILAQTYRTATTTGYSPKFNTWVDAAQVDVPHYGLKYVLDHQNYAPVGGYVFKMEFKYYITCKDVR